MKVSSTHTYAAPPDEVLTMLTDPDVLTAKYESLGHRDVRITEHEVDDGAVTVASKRSVPMDVPGFAKRFLSPMNTVEQRDEWDAPAKDGSCDGTWQVDAAGVPVTVGGTLRITPGTKKRTTQVEITAEVRSSIPIVGGKLASFIGGDVERTIAAEEDFNDTYLADR
jgi:hypothetical protein